MGLQISRRETPGTAKVKVNQRLFRTADNKRLVGDGDPDAAFLYCTPGLEVEAAEFESFLLDVEGGVIEGAVVEPVVEEKAEPPAEDKAVKAPPEDKGVIYPPATTRQERGPARRKRR